MMMTTNESAEPGTAAALSAALRIAVLVKQVPKFEQMELGSDGRLRRDDCELELNPYCRRAVSKAVEVAAERAGSCTVFTLGPPSAEDCLREAVAWGADEGVLVTDPAFAGSDTLATARAMAAAVRQCGPFDLVLVGRNSVDADTGQVGPEVAQLLGLPFLGGVREITLGEDATLSARCEYDDGFADAQVGLPAVISAAERLCAPAKRPPELRAQVPAERIRTLTAADLGDGPWGQDGSPTHVGAVRTHDIARQRSVLTGSPAEQVSQAVTVLWERGALAACSEGASGEAVPDGWDRGHRCVAVLCEPGRDREARELLGTAAKTAAAIGGRVVAVTHDGLPSTTLATWGADQLVRISGSVEEDVAAVVAGWAEQTEPWAILAAATMWGREVSGRIAARLGAGLTGDAVELGVDGGRLVGWKPAFGGRMVAAITADSPVQMATVRPGVLASLEPRPASRIVSYDLTGEPTSRVRLLRSVRDDDVEALLVASAVIGVGTGVSPEEYALLDPLREALGAELAATRKVTDKGWQPRARQVGLTGRSIAPPLYVCIGASGKYNHMVGVRRAGTVLAINPDADAPVVEHSDVVITADWREAVPLLVQALRTGQAQVRDESNALARAGAL
jgi:electron transfer flavoprotein alpha subunit